VIKIDRSIVSGLDTDPVLTTLVRSLVGFGHANQLRVVAEGVETGAEAAALRALGVDYGQGWYHGRPVAPELLSAAPAARVPGQELQPVH
jgi:EAL domain-containing protein (putative c-di-GMP-specific phosphodiesterase class I)